MSGVEIRDKVKQTYKEIIRRKRNIFLVPSGKAGKQFVSEITSGVNMFVSQSSMEEVAMMILMIMPALLLQKPEKKSKTRDHIKYPEKRLAWWKDGDLDQLVREGKAITTRSFD